jgi:carbon monoxide dehydrogenase subunit G
MEMTGSRVVPASIDAAWKALNDPDTLKACIPGCDSIERVSDHEYRVAMTSRVGPVSAKFNGKILLTDVMPPTSYTIRFEGQGGAAGFANGEAKVALAPDGTGARIDYTAKAQVGGKLAQIGSRLVDGAAAKVADDFFNALSTRLGAVVQSPAGGDVDAQAAKALRSMRIRLWLAFAILGAMALYWLTMRH